ncbi:uncharacterized protein DUF3592 [Mucilaginibacter frigoritolerans]|uniref:Uncharacterized protein DUF3592 n=1 Tax=Mucilaginibacter frigoritolerans TaxID=652788 RepID=A0A562TVR6_9SPHI|nr:DUF3592 domain-containing protein [Mucilaginibacter frigoritolerans]TWI97682.1 uncharacterized protein DUF3592 [Mucilaginibacter frigoritolerans]
MTNENIDLLIFILIGIAMIVFGNYKLTEYRNLINTGIKTEGIVFSIESSYDTADNMAYYHPIIRFTTKENEWVTERYDIGSSPCPYKVGESINIIYDPNDNKKFIIDNGNAKLLGPIIMILGGVFIVGSIIQYLHPFLNQSFKF